MPAEPNRASPRQVLGSTPEVLAEALREETNLAVWRRQLPGAVQAFVAQLAAQPGPLAESIALHCGAEDAAPDLSHLLAGHAAREGYAEFIADVAWLVSATVACWVPGVSACVCACSNAPCARVFTSTRFRCGSSPPISAQAVSGAMAGPRRRGRRCTR